MSDIVSVGQQVPNFEIEVYNPAEGGFGKLSLADLKAKGQWTVLFFYPGDYTFVCPTELAEVNSKYAEFAKAGATVISVSTDSKYVHLAWEREEKLIQGLKYFMGADTTGNISRMFGVYDTSNGLALRGTFIISPEGKLIASEVNFYNVGRSADELVRKLKANVYLSRHPTEACPANWTEGQKTLKPGAGLVGRVAEALA